MEKAGRKKPDGRSRTEEAGRKKPDGKSRTEEAGHKQAERDLNLKFFLKFFLDRQVRAVIMLLPASPTFDADRSGLI